MTAPASPSPALRDDLAREPEEVIGRIICDVWEYVWDGDPDEDDQVIPEVTLGYDDRPDKRTFIAAGMAIKSKVLAPLLAQIQTLESRLKAAEARADKMAELRDRAEAEGIQRFRQSRASVPAAMTLVQGFTEQKAKAEAAEQREQALQARCGMLEEAPRIEFHQHDWIPGFAAFTPGATKPAPESRAFCVLNLGSMLSTIEHGDMAAADLPYFIAESMMHEVMHAIEQWAGVEFSEGRIEALLETYRIALNQGASDAA